MSRSTAPDLNPRKESLNKSIDVVEYIHREVLVHMEDESPEASSSRNDDQKILCGLEKNSSSFHLANCGLDQPTRKLWRGILERLHSNYRSLHQLVFSRRFDAIVPGILLLWKALSVVLTTNSTILDTQSESSASPPY